MTLWLEREMLTRPESVSVEAMDSKAVLLSAWVRKGYFFFEGVQLCVVLEQQEAFDVFGVEDFR